jgi:hypothetical protein
MIPELVEGREHKRLGKMWQQDEKKKFARINLFKI